MKKRLLIAGAIVFGSMCFAQISFCEGMPWAQKRQEIARERFLPKNTYGRANPFALIPQKEAKRTVVPNVEPDLLLSGIIWSSREQKAIINGTVVKAGEEVAGYTILEIRRDDVLLTKEGQKYLLANSGLSKL